MKVITKVIVLLLLSVSVLGCASLSGNRLSARKQSMKAGENFEEKARNAIGDFWVVPPESQLQSQKKEKWWLALMPRVLAVVLGGLLLKNFIPHEKN